MLRTASASISMGSVQIVVVAGGDVSVVAEDAVAPVERMFLAHARTLADGWHSRFEGAWFSVAAICSISCHSPITETKAICNASDSFSSGETQCLPGLSARRAVTYVWTRPTAERARHLESVWGLLRTKNKAGLGRAPARRQTRIYVCMYTGRCNVESLCGVG